MLSFGIKPLQQFHSFGITFMGYQINHLDRSWTMQHISLWRSLGWRWHEIPPISDSRFCPTRTASSSHCPWKLPKHCELPAFHLYLIETIFGHKPRRAGAHGLQEMSTMLQFSQVTFTLTCCTSMWYFSLCSQNMACYCLYSATLKLFLRAARDTGLSAPAPSICTTFCSAHAACGEPISGRQSLRSRSLCDWEETLQLKRKKPMYASIHLVLCVTAIVLQQIKPICWIMPHCTWSKPRHPSPGAKKTRLRPDHQNEQNHSTSRGCRCSLSWILCSVNVVEEGAQSNRSKQISPRLFLRHLMQNFLTSQVGATLC